MKVKHESKTHWHGAKNIHIGHEDREKGTPDDKHRKTTLKVVFLDHFLDFEAKCGIVQDTSWAFNITELI